MSNILKCFILNEAQQQIVTSFVGANGNDLVGRRLTDDAARWGFAPAYVVLEDDQYNPNFTCPPVVRGLIPTEYETPADWLVSLGPAVDVDFDADFPVDDPTDGLAKAPDAEA